MFAEFDGVVVGLVGGEVDVVVFPSVDGGGGGAECFGDGVGVGAGWEVVDEVVGGEAPVVFGSAASVCHGVLPGFMGWGGLWRVQVGGVVGVMWRVMWLGHRGQRQITLLRLLCPSMLLRFWLSVCGRQLRRGRWFRLLSGFLGIVCRTIGRSLRLRRRR